MRLPYTKTNINYELSKPQITTGADNILSVITDRLLEKESSTSSGLVDYFKADLVSSSDYYPFGMVMGGRSFSTNQYRYGFNGKEKDDEGMGGGGSTYDYGFRIYNPQIAKFLSVDPLTGSYPWYTPYQFAGNMPIWAVDLDGLEELVYYYTLHNNDAKLVASAYIPENQRSFGDNGILLIGVDYVDKNNKIVFIQYQYTEPDGTLVMESMKIDCIKTKKSSGFFSSVGRFFRRLFGNLEGDGGWQAGGIAFYTEDGGASPTKYKSKNPADMVESDLLLAAIGTAGGARGKLNVGADAILDLISTGSDLFNVINPKYNEFIAEIEKNKKERKKAYDNELITLPNTPAKRFESGAYISGTTIDVLRKDSAKHMQEYNKKISKNNN